MATIISRLYGSEKAARALAKRLVWEGVPRRDVDVIVRQEGEAADALAARIRRLAVQDTAAARYAAGVADGATLVVVRATYKPLGAAKVARRMMDAAGPADVGLASEERKVADVPSRSEGLSVLTGHPKILSLDLHPGEPRHGGTVTGALGFRTIGRRRDRRSSVIHGGAHMTPFRVTHGRSGRSSVYHGGRYMSRWFWPMPLVSTRERSRSVIQGPGEVFSRALGWSTLIR